MGTRDLIREEEQTGGGLSRLVGLVARAIRAAWSPTARAAREEATRAADAAERTERTATLSFVRRVPRREDEPPPAGPGPIAAAVLALVVLAESAAAQCLPAFAFETRCGLYDGSFFPAATAVCPGEPLVCRSTVYNLTDPAACPDRDPMLDLGIIWYYFEVAEFPGDRRPGDLLSWFEWQNPPGFLENYVTPAGAATTWATTFDSSDGTRLSRVVLQPLVATADDAAQGFKRVTVHHAAASLLAATHAARADDGVPPCDALTGRCHVDIPVDIPVRRDCEPAPTTTTVPTTTVPSSATTTTTLPPLVCTTTCSGGGSGQKCTVTAVCE